MIRRLNDYSPREQRRIIRAVQRYSDPRMHIVWPVISAGTAIWIFINALLADAGVWKPLAKWFVTWMAGYIAICWTLDLIDDIRKEKLRLRKIADLKQKLDNDDRGPTIL